MDFYELAEIVANDLYVLRHPFIEKSESFRTSYFMGQAMWLAAEQLASQHSIDALLRLGKGLALCDDGLTDLIASSRELDTRSIKNVIDQLAAADERLIFLLDMKQFVLNDKSIEKSYLKALELYKRLFAFKQGDLDRLKRLNDFPSNTYVGMKTQIADNISDSKDEIYKFMVYFAPEKSKEWLNTLAKYIADVKYRKGTNPANGVSIRLPIYLKDEKNEIRVFLAIEESDDEEILNLLILEKEHLQSAIDSMYTNAGRHADKE